MHSHLKKISFQGELGAYSHLALESLSPHSEAIPCLNFKEAMDMVSAQTVDAAIIPVENSQWGRVTDVHFLLLETDLQITAEYFHRVRHQLLGVKNSSVSQVTHIHSHPQALGQCAQKIHALGAIAVAEYDTAGAAKIIANKNDPHHAAIASELAAKIYDLDILQENFEDKSHNTTRFILMQNKEDVPDYCLDMPYITAFIFTTRNIPAALFKVLGGFATNNINMIRIESYVNAAQFTSSCFYAEIEGHWNHTTIERAFEELNFFATDFKILGSFPMNEFRKQAET